MTQGPGRIWIDIVLALFIAVAAAAVAFAHVAAHYAPNAGDEETFRLVSAMVAPYRDDVLSPCMTRFGVVPDSDAVIALPQWRAFLTRHTDTFPCEALTGVPQAPASYNYWLHRHLHRALSTVFAVTGPRLSGFAYYQAIQYGLFLALIFGVMRLGMGRVVAALVMIPLAVSPRHLEMALAPIEYAKAPFFAACLLGVGLLVGTRMSARASYGVALATGLAVGFGFGFKPDVLVFAPFGVLALALFFRGVDGGRRQRALVVAAYAAGVLVAGAPMIRAHFFGPNRSLLPIQVLGGMAPAFDQEYAGPAIYDYGIEFDDGYVTAVINSYNQRVNGSREFGLFYSAVIQHGAIDLVARLQRTFAGDMLLRTWAAILEVFQFVPGGAVVALFALVWLCRIEFRLAWFVLFVIAYMVGYVSLVFAPKHYFHLEFVPWWFVGFAVAQGVAALGSRVRGAAAPGDFATHRPRHSWTTVAIAVTSGLVVAAGVVIAARLYQDRQVRGLLTRYVEPDRFERVTTRSIASGSSSTLVIPEGVAAHDVDAPPADSASLPRFDSPIVDTSYLALRLQCVGAAAADVVAVYRRPSYWRESLTIPCERADQMWTVMWPVYQHLPYQAFAGFECPGPALLRVHAVSRVRNLDGYPLLLRLRLPDDWTGRPMHHVLNLTAVSPARVRPVPAALTSPPPPLPPPTVAWDPPFVKRLTPLPIAAPALTAWTALEGVSVTRRDGQFVVRGNDSAFGYQLSSPPIAVSPHSRVVLRVFGGVEQGRVAVGVLGSSGDRWLLPPVWGRSDFVANTGASDRVFVVFANNRQPADEPVASRFAIDSITYDVQSSMLARIRTVLWPVAP